MAHGNLAEEFGRIEAMLVAHLDHRQALRLPIDGHDASIVRGERDRR
jgi:hypothetical protein